MDLIAQPILSTALMESRTLRVSADGDGGMQSIHGMDDAHPIRVLVFLEASTIAGAVKPVLEFAREAAESTTARTVKLTLALYVRAGKESGLIDTIRSQGLSVELIRERHAFDLQVVPQLRDLVRRVGPDVLWTNNTKSHFLVSLSGLYRTTGWIAFHHGYTKEAWRTGIYNELDRLSLPRAARVVTVCHDFAKQLQRKGVPADRIRVLRNPIRVSSPVMEAEKDGLRAQLGLEHSKVLLSVGRLSLEKGHADLLRAMERLRAAKGQGFDLHLLIVGDGPERDRLQRLCSKLSLEDCVSFTGHQADVRLYYAISDLFILPSHSEGSPNVLLEAMAAGLPIIATAVGGLPEVLSDEVNALLVPKQDVAQLVGAIGRLLDDPPLRQRLADQAKVVVAEHNPQAYYRSVVGLLNEVIGETTAK